MIGLLQNLPEIFSIGTTEYCLRLGPRRKRQVLYVTNIQKGPYATQAPAPNETPIQSEVAVPLIVGETEQVLGVLRVQSDQLSAFPPADRNFLQSLAQLLAATMTHHRRIEQLENDLQEIKILYNLQRQNDPEQIFDQNYAGSQILKKESDELSAVARLALGSKKRGDWNG